MIEKCRQCEHWNHKTHRCDRVIKMTLLIAHGGGDLNITTQNGLIPEHLEADLWTYLTDRVPTVIDAWPGWGEVLRIRDEKNGCAAEKLNVAIKEFGKRTLAVVEPEDVPGYLKFKSDISLW